MKIYEKIYEEIMGEREANNRVETDKEEKKVKTRLKESEKEKKVKSRTSEKTRPLTAYQIFVREESKKEEIKNLGAKERMNEIGKRWKRLKKKNT